MTRVLFVDDEPKVLHGLQRMLAGADCDWETEFVSGGREALALLTQQPFDVVVSDMRMPEMDGALLLSEIKRLYPHTVRIVLSGHSEREMVFRAIDAAHQYLAKPCDTAQLLNVVRRAIALRQLLVDLELRALLSRLSRIPSMPQAYRELMAQIERPNHSLKDLGKIVAQDVGMSAKILQIVNSAFFGLPRHVSDPIQAVCLLGLDVLRALITTVHIFTELSQDNLGDLGIENLWNHSTETGAVARMIAIAQGCEHQVRDHAMMAGLLHDTGKLILAVNETERCRDVLRRASKAGVALHVAEREVFGTTHAEVGAYLLGLWGLPDPVVEAVAFHHRPADCGATAFTSLTAVHVADVLLHAHGLTNEETPPGRLDMEYLQRLGLAERWPVWRDQLLAGAR